MCAGNWGGIIESWAELGVDSQVNEGANNFKLNFSAYWASLVPQKVKNPSAVREIRVQFLSQGDPLEEGMATHSNVLALEFALQIPWTVEPGGLQSMGSQSQAAKPVCSRACALKQEKPLQWGAHPPQRRVDPTQSNWRKSICSIADSVRPKINKETVFFFFF